MNIAIVGAGMAGLSCAEQLAASGHEIRLFDKGRGPGGRMSTRRVDTALGQASFDHGAQYFTVRDPDFAELAEQWRAEGIACPWPAAGHDAWVGTPAMNAPVKALAAKHDVTFGRPVTGLERADDDSWRIVLDGVPQGKFDAAVLALPAEQAAALLSLHDFELGCRALNARSQPCWTGMFAFAESLPLPDAPIRDAGDIAWAVRNSAKPRRTRPEAWVVQASPDWTREHLDLPAGEVAELLLRQLGDLAQDALPETLSAAAHRWRFAMSSATGEGALWNPKLRLGACGDWLLGPRVECAWLSGRETAWAIVDPARRQLPVAAE